MIGSPLLATALMHTWILPFGEPQLIKGNHRLLGLDFSPTLLLGSTTVTPSTGLVCGINSCNDQQVQKYCKQVVKRCNQHKLDAHMALILGKITLLAEDIQELKSIHQM